MKKVLSLVAVLVFAVSVGRSQTAGMSLIHHNIASGGQPQASANHIGDLLNLTPQKALVLLNEANYARQYFSLPHSGWQHNWPANPHEGRGNAIFVRNAAANVLASWTMAMQEDWTHNQPKDPRVYPAVKVQLTGTKDWVQFHCITVHFPTVRTGNGPARQESVDALIQASNDMPIIPLIICGDFNMSAAEAKTRIADPIGGKVYSNASVDHIIVRNGHNTGITNDLTVTRLGTMGSDHQAQRYDLTFNRLN